MSTCLLLLFIPYIHDESTMVLQMVYYLLGTSAVGYQRHSQKKNEFMSCFVFLSVILIYSYLRSY